MIYRCSCGKLKNGQPYRLASEVRFTCQSCMKDEPTYDIVEEYRVRPGGGVAFGSTKPNKTYRSYHASAS